MTPQELTEKYKQLNASYKNVLVWHTGVDAGFFAEYTAMLHAMLYCLEHRLQFRLYSDGANYGYEKGWEDYFLPFCPQDHHGFHRKYNLYALSSWRKLWQRPAKERRRLIGWKLKLALKHAIGNVLSFCTYGHRVRLSHHVQFTLNRHFCIPELEIDGDYFHAFSKMVDITWHFNEATAEECHRLTASLRMGPNAAGCQIRGGDKVTETALLPPEHYVDIIRCTVPAGHDIFVLTDDYALFRQARTLAPEYTWHTLCSPEEAGYINSSFIRTGGEIKRQQMTRFLTSMQILRSTSPFFGSVTPGPSLFILKLSYPNAHAVDCSAARLAEALTLPVAGRSQIADEYLKEEGKEQERPFMHHQEPSPLLPETPCQFTST